MAPTSKKSRAVPKSIPFTIAVTDDPAAQCIYCGKPYAQILEDIIFSKSKRGKLGGRLKRMLENDAPENQVMGVGHTCFSSGIVAIPPPPATVPVHGPHHLGQLSAALAVVKAPYPYSLAFIDNGEQAKTDALEDNAGVIEPSMAEMMQYQAYMRRRDGPFFANCGLYSLENGAFDHQETDCTSEAIKSYQVSDQPREGWFFGSRDGQPSGPAPSAGAADVDEEQEDMTVSLSGRLTLPVALEQDWDVPHTTQRDVAAVLPMTVQAEAAGPPATLGMEQPPTLASTAVEDFSSFLDDIAPAQQFGDSSIAGLDTFGNFWSTDAGLQLVDDVAA